MPEKDGDDKEKNTNSVVNKKQKPDVQTEGIRLKTKDEYVKGIKSIPSNIKKFKNYLIPPPEKSANPKVSSGEYTPSNRGLKIPTFKSVATDAAKGVYNYAKNNPKQAGIIGAAAVGTGLAYAGIKGLQKRGERKAIAKSVVRQLEKKKMMNTEEFSDKQRSDMKDILNKNFGSEDKSKETAGKLIKDKAKKDVERVQGGKQPNKSTPSTKLGRSKVDLNKYFGEEGYDIARDMGRVRPSKDKKDATTMPPSKEMEKTRKVNKGPSALDIVKKKYKGQIMDVKKEELDLTQVAEAFGGYIVEQTTDDEKKTKQEKSLRDRVNKGTGTRTLSPKPIGPKPNVSDQYTKAMRQNVKKGEKLLDKLKSFKDPEADKQRTDAENDPDLEKIGQKETGKKEPKKFFDAEKAKEKRANLIAKRKEYGIDRKGNISDAGIERYAKKTKQLSSGSNVPVKLTQADKDLAKIRAVGTGEKGTDVGKYGGRLGRTRGKNMPSLDQVKADIDKRNPTYTGQSGGQLPFPTRKSSYKSPVDKVLDDIRNVKKAGPEKQKEVEDKLRNIPDDPRIRIGKTSGDYIRTDPKTGKETELSQTGKTRTFGTLSRRAEKAQQTTKKGALVGLAVKTMTPASAGVEAAERLRKGEKGVTASVIQALDIPVLSQAAGVYNAVQTYRRGQQATPEPQPQADSGGKGGGKGKKTSVATSGGKSKEPTQTGGSDPADVAQLRYLGSRLPEVGAKLKKLRIPKLVGGMVGRRSAQGGGAA